MASNRLLLMASKILVGTCGFCCSQKRYFETFPVIEIQQIFYQPPEERIVARWRELAPAGFEFTLKAFQAITHPASSPTWRRSRFPADQRAEAGFFRDTPVVRQAWETTRRLAAILRASIVVFQCRPGSIPVRNIWPTSAGFSAGPNETICVSAWKFVMPTERRSASPAVPGTRSTACR
jgi:hypothetical protein